MSYAKKTILKSASRTSDGEGELVETTKGLLANMGPAMQEKARFYLNVSAVSGTSPTLDVDIVATIGGEDYVLASFTQKTAAGKETITIDGCPKEVKAVYTLGGTSPDFTFEVHSTRG